MDVLVAPVCLTSFSINGMSANVRDLHTVVAALTISLYRQDSRARDADQNCGIDGQVQYVILQLRKTNPLVKDDGTASGTAR